MEFRPCIDLHDGKVKQIVGSSLKDSGEATTNFVSEHGAGYFADLYFNDGLRDGHVIMLGKGNEVAAKEALSRHPGNLQLGGGVTPDNAKEWLDAGAGKIIVTSWLFSDGELDMERVKFISQCVSPERLVLDLSCLKAEDGRYHVACNRWQTVCQAVVDADSLGRLASFCAEYLVHAVSVEGKRGGIDQFLVEKLAKWSPIPVTYAGGIRNLEDVRLLHQAGEGRVNFTVGSALDIFGGNLPYAELVKKTRFLDL